MSGDADEIAKTPTPISMLRHQEPMTGRRRPLDLTNAEAWRDVLLQLSTKLPLEGTLEELAREFVDGVAPLVPGCALGVCLVESGGPGPVVVYRLPVGSPRSVDRDPTRLFPSFRAEH